MSADQAPSTIAATVAWQWKCRIDAVCERFEDAWGSVPDPSVEEYLKSAEVPETRRSALLSELLKLERELRQKRGEKPGASEYLARFPGQAMIVRSVFGEDRIGEYDLIAPIGEGGMGVVYHARHRRIGREVALKMIRPYCLDDSSAVDRFRLEAQLAARLDHEHIVTVYEAGQADGQHFYAMRYIVGQSLAEIINKHPIEDDRAARYLEQVSRAVDFAHTHDVLHRDLKPRNILVDLSDRAFVTDFGLAKILNLGTGATRTDDRLGTPPYMSPEQVRDPSRAGVSSDIYSLGATLYEALTGRPPFVAENPLEIYRQVLDDEPKPPRMLNPRCSRDLETICLKCLHKDPSRRYPSALELAEDLRRFREGSPIRARRVGVFERTGKWASKHPTAAALILVSALAAVAVAVVVQTQRYNAILGRSDRTARDAVDRFAQFGVDRLADHPDRQAELLAIALGYYDEFLRQRGDDPALADELAATYTRVARLTNSLGKSFESLKAQELALALRRKLALGGDEPRRHLSEMAENLHQIGILSRQVGNRDRTIAAYRESLKIREDLVNADPKMRAFLDDPHVSDLSPRDRALVSDLARSYGYLGDWEREGGMRDDAKRSYRKSQELRERLVATDPNDLLAKFQLGRSYGNAGILEREDGLLDASFASYRHALALQQELVDLGPEVAQQRLDAECKAASRAPDFDYDDFLTDLASSHNSLGLLYRESNNKADALAEHQVAKAIFKGLVDTHPSLTRWNTELGISATYVGELNGSDDELEEGQKLLSQLYKANPKIAGVRSGFARNKYARGVAAASRVENVKAQKLFTQALELQESLVQEQPRTYDFRLDRDRTKQAIASLGSA